MKATLFTMAATMLLLLTGCSENGTSPTSLEGQSFQPFDRSGGVSAGFTSSGGQESRRDSLKVKGFVTAVDTLAGTVTLGARVVQTNSQTRIERNGRHVPLSAVQIGDRGEAKLLSTSGIASSLETNGMGIGGEVEDHEVEGTVTAVDTGAGTVTIGTTVVHTNAQTIIKRNHVVVALSAIQVGDRAEARLSTAGGTAFIIEAESEGGGGGGGDDTRVEGTVTAVNATAGTLTIGTRVVQTNAQTSIERNGMHVPLSAIQIGDQGEARIPAGSTVASRVQARS